MNKQVIKDYEINRDTIALLPAYHSDYYTIVLERDQEYYVKQTPMQLIKEACLEGGADYAGRRKAVIHKLGVQSKVPIPVNPLDQIFAFPTHSPKLHECSWIFYHHIRSIRVNAHEPSQTIISFKNYKELPLSISYPSLEKQMHRTAYCIVRFSKHPENKPPQLGA
ncbi:competence protein ComK [Halalkalibacter alkaliphilus]|uniref:Competence protein ComK n=1 Tax=Halalkalibacter alkaliphilus TaxID=2917993 RepID=A0A9X2CVA4_9BACI|nr:competence protein ComK [Halalkalibacter alkaliphilus]MCL7748760.1 competence protein ComK [Halalkalibacter alkaliphilus]